MQGYGSLGSTSVGPSPKEEGCPSYKSVAVTYAATIVTAGVMSSLAANHGCRRKPGPLCGRSHLSNMAASYRVIDRCTRHWNQATPGQLAGFRHAGPGEMRVAPAERFGTGETVRMATRGLI